MSKKYFSIERNNETWMPVILADYNGNPVFEEFLEMSYEEMKASDELEHFVLASLDAADRKSSGESDQTAVTLIGEDGCFVWGILIGSDENDDVRYALVDWQKDGSHYRYES